MRPLAQAGVQVCKTLDSRFHGNDVKNQSRIHYPFREPGFQSTPLQPLALQVERCSLLEPRL